MRNWGTTGNAEMIRACAEVADASTLDSIWINDHIGLPPKFDDNPYGIPSDMGTILDPLGVCCYFAAATQRIHFGVGVLILPYRPHLLTAKWIATIQSLSNNRFLLGTGVGYVEAEFKALGVPRNRRGAITDDILDFLDDCTHNDVVTRNGTQLVLRPKLHRPPTYIGGAPDTAIPRAVRRGDGWMPVGMLPNELKPHIEQLNRLAADAGRPPMEVVHMKTLPLSDPPAALEMAQAYASAGVTQLVHTQAYADIDEYKRVVDQLCGQIGTQVS